MTSRQAYLNGLYSEKLSLPSQRLTNKEDMLIVGKGGGEDIDAAALRKLQFFSELCHGKGEVPDGNISVMDISQSCFQFLFVHR